MSFLAELFEFLKKYKVIGLAVAFVISNSSAKLVSAIVNDIIMPIVGVLVPGGTWQSATLTVGPMHFLIGDFVSALLDFLLIALVVFMLVKWVVRKDFIEDKNEQ